MTVRNLSLPEPDYTLCASSLVGDALRQMHSSRRYEAPVLDAEGRFYGMFRLRTTLNSLFPATARNGQGLHDPGYVGNARALLQEHLMALRVQPVAELVDRKVVRLHDDTPLLEAVLLLAEACGPLPVVMADGRLRGLLSEHEILAHLHRTG